MYGQCITVRGPGTCPYTLIRFSSFLNIVSQVPVINDPISISNHIEQSIGHLGSYHFLGGGGDRLFVMAGSQFFLVPPFACVKKYWSPPLPMGKNTGPPLCLQKNSFLT